MRAPDHGRIRTSLAGADWLVRTETQTLLALLRTAGHTARVVGGCVRNALLGRPVSDIDIATTARPEAVMAVAEAAHLNAVPTGIEHGTVTVIVSRVPYEVTTLRRDVATDGRRAVVAFTEDWSLDAGRRDFTMNALYCDADGTVFDPLGGLDDLLARRVRFIGDADTRIREDYLRILRFFRFHAQYTSDALDPAGLAACARQREGLATLSGERIRQELVRIVIAPGCVHAIQAACESGIVTTLLGVAPHPQLFERLVAIDVLTGAAPDPALRVAMLTTSTSEDAARINARLKLSAAEREALTDAASCHPLGQALTSDAAARRWLYTSRSNDRFRSRIRAAWAHSGDATDDSHWSRLHDLPERWPRPDFPLRGADVLALGMSGGPAVGAILARVEAWWIETDFPNDRKVLLDRLAAEAAVISSP